MEWCHKEFSELVGILNTNPRFAAFCPDSAAEVSTEPDVLRETAVRAAAAYRDGRFQDIAPIIESARSLFTVMPVPLFRLLLAARQLTNQEDRIAGDFLELGCTAVDHGQYETGAEAIGAAFVEDFAGALNLVYKPEQVRRGTDRYEVIARHIEAIRPLTVDRKYGDRMRIGMLVSNLVDNVVAYTKRVLDFSRYLDFRKYDLRVYSTENMCNRARSLPCRHMADSSEKWGGRSLTLLRERNIPVYLAKRTVPILDAAHDVASQIVSDGIDVLILQAGPTMPIDWLAARLADVPVKIHIHIGIPLYQRGVDVTLFDNKVNMDRERLSWPPYAGDTRLMRQGTDLESLDRQDALERGQLGLTSDDLVIGVLSNHLDSRLSREYLDVITAVMKDYPQTRFVPVGGRKLPDKASEHFRLAGVEKQVIHISTQNEVGKILKVLDIFAAEFPVSGSQSVVEAMACGIPVVAMRSSNTHVGSTAVDIMGPDYEIGHNDPDAYRMRLVEWITNADARRAAGTAMRMRAEQELSIEKYVGKVCRLAENVLQQKQQKQELAAPCAV
ncbi:MAG: glycosyltransferase [bacterium]